jgi:hypothetical protein
MRKKLSFFPLFSRRIGQWHRPLRLAADGHLVGPRLRHTALLALCLLQGKMDAILKPVRKQKLGSRNDKALLKLCRFVTETFFYASCKRANFGRAMQATEQSFVLRTGLSGRDMF